MRMETGRKVGEEGGAAELASAGADAADHACAVADADLSHLDAGAEAIGEISDEIAEVDASFGGEVEDGLGAIVHVLDLDELHGEVA
jgi:hypothetical protein